jgi:hypothetical protein
LKKRIIRRSRVDRNQQEIVQALRDRGASVLQLHNIGKGCPDLLCSIVGEKGSITFLVEVKDSSQPPSKQRLTPDESEFHYHWQGKIFIVNSVEKVHKLLNELYEKLCNE